MKPKEIKTGNFLINSFSFNDNEVVEDHYLACLYVNYFQDHFGEKFLIEKAQLN